MDIEDWEHTGGTPNPDMAGTGREGFLEEMIPKRRLEG